MVEFLREATASSPSTTITTPHHQGHGVAVGFPDISQPSQCAGRQMPSWRQLQISLRCCCAFGAGPCGKRAAFSSHRPREAGFPWAGGRGPWGSRPIPSQARRKPRGFILAGATPLPGISMGGVPLSMGQSAPEQGPAPGGSGGVRPLRIPRLVASAPWRLLPDSWSR